MQISHDMICAMVPHAGKMCLIDEVEAWDDDSISCISHSHNSATNPLIADNELSVVNAIEYGAQSMAIHGALLAKRIKKTLPPGYLAAARDVKFGTVQRLDALGTPLRINSKKMLSSGGNLMYSFEILSGNDLIVSARLTVAAQVDI